MAGPATGLLIGSLALSAGATGMSFLQAGKQKRLQEKIDKDAQKVMDAARKKLDVNYLDALAINKLPYELEREAMLVSGAQAIDAARESERGAPAGVGRVQLAQQKGQANVRSAKSKELYGLDLAAAQEDSRLRDVGVQLDLGEVAGAQMASADASQAAAAATTQGFQQLASFGAQALQAAPLFSKSAGVQASNKAYRQANTAGKEAFMKVKGKQGISFSETDFLANPQSFINRGSVQQQALFNNALTGGALMPIEDDEFVVETDLSDMDPMNLLGYLNNKRRM